jgi:hypothetical protein
VSKAICSGGLALARHPLAAERQADQHVQPGRHGDQAEAQGVGNLQVQDQAGDQHGDGLADHHQPALGDQGANP